MAVGKKSFILYSDVLNVVEKLILKDRENKTNYAGELFYHILQYVNDKNPIPVDFIIEMIFEPIKTQLKRDLIKYENIIDRNRENGLKGGRPKNPKEPNGLIGKPKNPKEPDNDNDNDSVTVSVPSKEGICQKMIFSFKNVFPEYYSDENVDLPSTLKIANHIAKQKGWPVSSVTNGRMDDIISEWDSIIEFTKDHSLYSNFSIQDLEKKWTGVIQAKTAVKVKKHNTQVDNNSFI